MKKSFLILVICLGNCTLWAQDTEVLSTSDTLWRNDPAFAYMATIDSMLRDADHSIDSANANRKVLVGSNTAASTGFAAFFQNTAVQIFFWSVLALFIAYIIYALFFRYPAGKAVNENLGTEILEDGKLLDEDIYRQKIAAAEKEGDYRQAVRHYFLLTLAQLDALQKIHFTPEKTNADYVIELKNDYRRDGFKSLSDIFTYVWYGKRRISIEEYNNIRQIFSENYSLT